MKPRRILALATLFVASLLLFGLPGQTLAADTVIADFEGGLPADWFQYSGGGATMATSALVVADTDPLARPGQVGDNTVMDATFNASVGFAGFGQDFGASTGSQDWSTYSGVSFWMYGTNSGITVQFEIFDNGSDGTGATAERFDTTFTDDFAGWQEITIPFTDFTRATDFQPGGAPDDGLTLTEMWGWAVPVDGANGGLVLDDITLGQTIVDDFESGLPSGVDGNGIGIGFVTFNDPSSTVGISTTTTPPAPVPGSSPGNNVLQVDTNVVGGGFAGVVHAFENAAVDTWTPQDWSAFNGISFWLYGNNTGSILFVDILDNRNPGSTTDDAERFSLDIIDDFSGWQLFEFPWEAFSRKEIGNGAPNDGFTLTQVHGWAFGVFSSGQAFTNYIDDVALFGVAETPELSVGFSANNYNVPEGTTGDITVKLNRPMNSDDPAQVTVDYATEPGTPVPGEEYIPVSGTITFTNGGASELSFPLVTFDDDKFEGDERVILRLSNPVGALPGFILQASGTIVDDDPFDAALIDDFERPPDLWHASPDVSLSSVPAPTAGSIALEGVDPAEHVLRAVAPADPPGPQVVKQDVLNDLLDLFPTGDKQTEKHLTAAVLRLSQSLDPGLWINDFYLDEADGRLVFTRERQAAGNLEFIADSGVPEAAAAQAALDALVAVDEVLARVVLDRAIANGGNAVDILRAEERMMRADSAIASGDYAAAIGHYRSAWISSVHAVLGLELAPTQFGRDFAIGQDWSFSDALTFWYFGQNSGDTITINLLDNRAPDPGPPGWSLVWADEFNEPAGTPPNPDNWSYEIGDGVINGIPGWGNDELQYYTDDPANAATDGAGNLVITAREADGSLPCYYGPCEYTSARLLSWHKAEFAYGRIESRILVPDGGPGLWPAFWSLGTDIDVVGWPQTGEIDIMEYVSRLPEEIFGTIHGPGYAGGASYGDTYPFPGGVSLDYHTFTIEWQPDLIEWYVDGILYHTATPADVAPNEWVFNDPVFLLLNLAIGGNFGGPVDPGTTFPQEYKVDYVRVYQGPDTAERFESSFVDDFIGWQQIEVPFSTFTRSADQPAGAPDDGLNLTEVWGYGFTMPDPGSWAGEVFLDQVRLRQPTEVTVTNTNDDGVGSLRWATEIVASGGTVLFDPSLAGQTITLSSGPIVISGKEVTIDGTGVTAATPEGLSGLTVSGGGVDRVLIVEAGATATVKHLTLADGFGWQLAGGVLNNGTLTLDHATVTNNVMATDAGDFWQGGGGIYSGDGATLNLYDSAIVNNTAAWSGGGVYGFFNTTTTISNTTISGNVSNDVGGGIRSLGNAEIVNSTISGNESTGWHGGAIFVTDGVVNVLNTTMAANVSPGGTADVFVGTFGPSDATLSLTNTIVSSAGDNCFVAFFGAGTVTLATDHNNVFTDGTCFVGASDQVVADVMLGPLADNGGATQTHALLTGSPAIDTADNAVCPAEDQRGVTRVDGACDVGSYEVVP